MSVKDFPTNSNAEHPLANHPNAFADAGGAPPPANPDTAAPPANPDSAAASAGESNPNGSSSPAGVSIAPLVQPMDTAAPSGNATSQSMTGSQASTVGQSSSASLATSVSAAISGTSAPSASDPSQSASTSPPPNFTKSPFFVLLMILVGFVVVAMIATSAGCFLKWKRRKHPDDYDDTVKGEPASTNVFEDTASTRRSSILSRRTSIGGADADEYFAQTSLSRRSTLYASRQQGTPYLHCGPEVYQTALPGNPRALNLAEQDAEPDDPMIRPAKEHSPTIVAIQPAQALPKHVNGENCVLSCCREDAITEHGTPREGGVVPRWMGVEGQGLDTPWLRSASPETVSAELPEVEVSLNPPKAQRMVAVDSDTSAGETASVTWASTLKTNFIAAVGAVTTKMEGQRIPDEERGQATPIGHGRSLFGRSPQQLNTTPRLNRIQVERTSKGTKMYRTPQLKDEDRSMSGDSDTSGKIPVSNRGMQSRSPSPVTMTRTSTGTSSGRYYTPSDDEVSRGRAFSRVFVPSLARVDSVASSVYSTVSEKSHRVMPTPSPLGKRVQRYQLKDQQQSPRTLAVWPQAGRARSSAAPRKQIVVPRVKGRAGHTPFLGSADDTSTGDDTDGITPYRSRPGSALRIRNDVVA